MTTFADKLHTSITTNKSHLVAGCDPAIDKLPQFLVKEAASKSASDDIFFERILKDFSELFVTAISQRVAAVKPNIAFFEQYGLAGLRAFTELCSAVRHQGIPLIIDAKRGDIGSTAAAYSTAFLGRVSVHGRTVESFTCDAVTVNPFLGFDTLEPFVKDCLEYGKGIFILVQTSNPGAKDLQGLQANGARISDHVARWVATHGDTLLGKCGWSGLGAVVGASYPQDAKHLRELMPKNFFLIPGLGAQGASAQDAVAGFGMREGKPGGAVINVSRGLLEGNANSRDELVTRIRENTETFNQQISAALRATAA